jgi:putative endonuclease
MYYVYIITNINDKVLYTGMTNDLVRRISEHRDKIMDGFGKRYCLFKLVHFKEFDNVLDAIDREKQIKKYSRQKKLELIAGSNPNWTDLWNEIV